MLNPRNPVRGRRVPDADLSQVVRSEEEAIALIRDDLRSLDWMARGSFFIPMKVRLAALGDNRVDDALWHYLAEQPLPDVKYDLGVYNNMIVRGHKTSLEKLVSVLDSGSALEHRVPVAASLNGFAFGHSGGDDIFPDGNVLL